MNHIPYYFTKELEEVDLIYTEDAKSQQLYYLNKKRCLSENFVYEEGMSIIKKIIHKLFLFLNRVKKIRRSQYYDRCESSISEYIPVRGYSYDKMPKLVVYTAVLGKYDELHEPLYVNGIYDFVLITDNKDMIKRESSWNFIDINDIKNMIPNGLNNVQLNRWLKMNPNIIFPDYDVSIYVDGNVNVVTDMMPIALDFFKTNAIIGLHLHANRKKILSEIKMLSYCGKISKDDEKRAIKQYENYKLNGFDDSIGLLEATIIIRKHNEDLCVSLMRSWWDEFINGVQRDQISLPYVLWKNKFSMSDLYLLGDNEYANPRFFIDNHII